MTDTTDNDLIAELRRRVEQLTAELTRVTSELEAATAALLMVPPLREDFWHDRWKFANRRYIELGTSQELIATQLEQRNRRIQELEGLVASATSGGERSDWRRRGHVQATVHHVTREVLEKQRTPIPNRLGIANEMADRIANEICEPADLARIERVCYDALLEALSFNPTALKAMGMGRAPETISEGLATMIAGALGAVPRMTAPQRRALRHCVQVAVTRTEMVGTSREDALSALALLDKLAVAT